MKRNECFEWERLTLKDKARLTVARIKSQINKGKDYPIMENNAEFDDEEIII